MKSLFFLYFFLLLACDDSNVNEVFSTEKEKNTYSYKLLEAQRAYDKKDFSKSLSIINKMIEKHGDSEDLTLLKTYSTFGLSGFDPIDVSRRFIGAWKIRTNSELNRIERFVAAIDYIGQLSSDEFYDIYTIKTKLQGFAEDLRVPIEDTHNNITSTRMSYIIQAARLLCNQVDEYAQYFDWGCTPTTKDEIKYESHILWARIHFAESVLLINTIVRALSIGRNSLLNKIANLRDDNSQSYVDSMAQSRLYLAEVFPVDSSKTMIKFIINDWLTIINSFNMLGQKKSKLKEILLQLQSALQEKMLELPDSYTDKEKKVIILKNIFSKKILFEWQAYYTENEDNMTEVEKNEFCTEYQSLDTLDIYPFTPCS